MRNILGLLSRDFWAGQPPGKALPRPEDAPGSSESLFSNLARGRAAREGGRHPKRPITAGLVWKSAPKRGKNSDFLSTPFPGKGFCCPGAEGGNGRWVFNLFSADFIAQSRRVLQMNDGFFGSLVLGNTRISPGFNLGGQLRFCSWALKHFQAANSTKFRDAASWKAPRGGNS